MDFAKEVVLPVALSEFLGPTFSFLFDRFPRPAGRADAHRRRLERLLANIGSTVEEAEGRHITNQRLLFHLKVLTEGMYRGRFALETADFGVISNTDNVDGDDAMVRRLSFGLSSSFNSAKRFRMTGLTFGGGGGGGDDCIDKLTTVADDLESLTCDYMRGFILLVQGYPRRVTRPVTTTLYMDRCVFGRHVERERIVNFLLRPVLAGAPYLSVLPVVGGKKVGKTTLVKHACDDQRVRDHFAHIEWFEMHHVVKEGGRADQTVWDSDGPEYFSGVRNIIGKETFAARKSLLVFEDAWHIDEEAWAALAASPTTLATGSKLLFTSRDMDLARLGTVEPVVLKHPPKEECWYYFKAFAFGGTPKDRRRGKGDSTAAGGDVPGGEGARRTTKVQL